MTEKGIINFLKKNKISLLLIVGALIITASFGAFNKSYAATSGTYGTCSWNITNGKLTIMPTTEGTSCTLGSATYYYRIPWYSDKNNITSVEVKQGVIANANSDYLFYGLNKARTIDVTKLDTSNVISMNSIFTNCSSLTNLDLSSFNTSNVTNMYSMFSNCRSLTSLDLSSFNTSNVTNMSNMFAGCTSLTSINLSSFNTNNVTQMQSMFYNCSALTSLDLSSFNTSNVTNMNSMFYYCYNLTSLDLSSFNTSNVTNMNSMFYNCTKLTSLDLSSFNTSNVTTMESMFYYCYNLTSINLSSFNTSKVTTMRSMFYNCYNLTSINLSSFNTSNVTNMYAMFYNCTKLTSLDLSNFNTSKVTTMESMFADCSSLTSLNLSNFNASNVIDMEFMFARCSSLTSLNLSNFNASKVTNMSNMFADCSSLTSLDLSSFNPSEVITMRSMFYNCTALTNIDFTNFNPSNAYDMVNMFAGCTSLTSLDLSSFDTSNVTDMQNMFYNCTSLTSLDISSFDTRNVRYMLGMFANVGGSVTKGTEFKFSNKFIRNCTASGEAPGSSVDCTLLPYKYYSKENNNNLDNRLYTEQEFWVEVVNNSSPTTWVPSFKVTFDGNGGVLDENVNAASKGVKAKENTTVEKTYRIGTKINAKNIHFIKDNYIFTHFVDNESNPVITIQKDGESDEAYCGDYTYTGPEEKNVLTLYAQYKEKGQVVVTYKIGDQVINILNVNEGTKIKLSNLPAKEGYRVTGWMINGKEYKPSDEVEITKDTVIEAIYEKTNDSSKKEKVVPKKKQVEKYTNPATGDIIKKYFIYAGISLGLIIIILLLLNKDKIKEFISKKKAND